MIKVLKQGQIAYKGPSNDRVQIVCNKCKSILSASLSDGFRVTTGHNTSCLFFRCPVCNNLVKEQ